MRQIATKVGISRQRAYQILASEHLPIQLVGDPNIFATIVGRPLLQKEEYLGCFAVPIAGKSINAPGWNVMAVKSYLILNIGILPIGLGVKRLPTYFLL